MSYELLDFQAGMRKNASNYSPYQTRAAITHNS